MANEKKKTSIGGQALIEGIMMRGPFLTSMATRLPDGSIDVETWNTHKGGQKAHWTRRVPFLRGIFNMVDSMVVGYGCLMKSAEKAGVEEEPTKFDNWLEEKLGDNLMKVLGGVAVVLGVALVLDGIQNLVVAIHALHLQKKEAITVHYREVDE